VKFVNGRPVLINKSSLIIGDLHLGVPEILSLNKTFYDQMAFDINKMCHDFKCNRLIILGDVKDDITIVPDYLYDFFEMIKVDVTIVKGNHDGMIEKLCSHFGFDLCPTSGCVIDGVGLFHGHTWPSAEIMAQKHLVMTHLHQVLKITDKFGKRISVPVVLKSAMNSDVENLKLPVKYSYNPDLQLIVLPAFNPLMGHEIGEKSLRLSPILRNNVFKLNSIYVYNMTGSLLGKLADFLEGEHG